MTTTTTKPSPWSIRIDAYHYVPDEDAVFEIEEELGNAGAVGPSISYLAEASRVGARFFVEDLNPVKAFARAMEILKEVLPDAEIVAFEGMTEDELDARLKVPVIPVLAGAAELAQLLHVSKQRFHEVRRMEGFPEPVCELASGPVWAAASVNHFVETWPRKPGRPRRVLVGSP